MDVMIFCFTPLSGEVHSFRVPEVDAEDIAISEGIRFQAHSDLVTDMLVLFPIWGLFFLTVFLSPQIIIWGLFIWRSGCPGQPHRGDASTGGHARKNTRLRSHQASVVPTDCLP